ncbi:hypothetical protein KI809_04400 [Geobacter pelophilus]|uniref:Uncharacterized protein n=1 Tax=Geoanaerobacter pelophilus TaxID=60036 RepID=A0AAW4L1X7_9BACT|nr:hypothetical protein [Geoanaerobacter pelophilus]MBT0663537.1 hypothetical protein [Geoanaerobacter pelophilus]
MRILHYCLLFLLAAEPAIAAHKHLEKEYQKEWCDDHFYKMEYPLEDGSHIDCLTETHAVEVEFAPKWAESVGQSLYYALKTGKQPGVVLILESSKDRKFLERLQAVADGYGIAVWTMRPGDLKR